MEIKYSVFDFGKKNSNPRNSKVCIFTPHVMGGNMSALNCARMHKNGDSCSANFYIGSDGSLVLGVPEERRPWTSSSPSNDHAAITVEVANIKGRPNYEISNAAYNTLVRLCAYVCLKYKFEPYYDGTKNASITEHRMFNKKKECPGNYLHNILASGKFEKDVKAVMYAEKGKPIADVKPKVEEKPVQTNVDSEIDRVAREVISGKWGIGAARKTALTNAGYDYKKVQARVNELLKK